MMGRPYGIHSIYDMFGGRGTGAGLPDGRWVRAVPEPYTGNRLVSAWWVLTGRAYAVVWPKAGELEDIVSPEPPQAMKSWMMSPYGTKAYVRDRN